MTRYKIDCLGDIAQVQNLIRSNRKTAQNAVNPKSAAICDAVLPSLQVKLAKLEAELETLQERPELTFNYNRGSHLYSRTTPLTQAEVDALAVPDFLVRT